MDRVPDTGAGDWIRAAGVARGRLACQESGQPQVTQSFLISFQNCPAPPPTCWRPPSSHTPCCIAAFFLFLELFARFWRLKLFRIHFRSSSGYRVCFQVHTQSGLSPGCLLSGAKCPCGVWIRKLGAGVTLSFL